MVISQITGDLLHDDAEVLVNTVNCKGAMGKGIALEFKKRFPAMFKDYQRACRSRSMRPGQMHVWANPWCPGNGILAPQGYPAGPSHPRLIVNFPTKDDWRAPSQLSWIQEGLVDLRHVILTQEVASIALPPLGCGLGGLDWKVVEPMIDEVLSDLTTGPHGLDLRIYPPK